MPTIATLAAMALAGVGYRKPLKEIQGLVDIREFLNKLGDGPLQEIVEELTDERLRALGNSILHTMEKTHKGRQEITKRLAGQLGLPDDMLEKDDKGYFVDAKDLHKVLDNHLKNIDNLLKLREEKAAEARLGPLTESRVDESLTGVAELLKSLASDLDELGQKENNTVLATPHEMSREVNKGIQALQNRISDLDETEPAPQPQSAEPTVDEPLQPQQQPEQPQPVFVETVEPIQAPPQPQEPTIEPQQPDIPQPQASSPADVKTQLGNLPFGSTQPAEENTQMETEYQPAPAEPSHREKQPSRWERLKEAMTFKRRTSDTETADLQAPEDELIRQVREEMAEQQQEVDKAWDEALAYVAVRKLHERSKGGLSNFQNSKLDNMALKAIERTNAKLIEGVKAFQDSPQYHELKEEDLRVLESTIENIHRIGDELEERMVSKQEAARPSGLYDDFGNLLRELTNPSPDMVQRARYDNRLHELKARLQGLKEDSASTSLDELALRNMEDMAQSTETRLAEINTVAKAPPQTERVIKEARDALTVVRKELHRQNQAFTKAIPLFVGHMKQAALGTGETLNADAAWHLSVREKMATDLHEMKATVEPLVAREGKLLAALDAARSHMDYACLKYAEIFGVEYARNREMPDILEKVETPDKTPTSSKSQQKSVSKGGTVKGAKQPADTKPEALNLATLTQLDAVIEKDFKDPKKALSRVEVGGRKVSDDVEEIRTLIGELDTMFTLSHQRQKAGEMFDRALAIKEGLAQDQLEQKDLNALNILNEDLNQTFGEWSPDGMPKDVEKLLTEALRLCRENGARVQQHVNARSGGGGMEHSDDPLGRRNPSMDKSWEELEKAFGGGGREA